MGLSKVPLEPLGSICFDEPGLRIKIEKIKNNADYEITEVKNTHSHVKIVLMTEMKYVPASMLKIRPLLVMKVCWKACNERHKKCQCQLHFNQPQNILWSLPFCHDRRAKGHKNKGGGVEGERPVLSLSRPAG